MKLLDLIVDKVDEWPHSVGRMYQTTQGWIIASGGWGDSWIFYGSESPKLPIVEDRDTALVTKTQWQAERDRRKIFST